MQEITLKYQPVIHPDGTVAIHETILDEDGAVKAASYEAVRLEATSLGELEEMLRLVYRHIRKLTPITYDELDELMYNSEECLVDEDSDKVVNLIDYFNGQR